MPALANTVTATTTHEVRLSPAVRRKLLTELRTYEQLKQQKAAIESAMEKHKTIIAAIREETGEQTIKLEGFSVTLVAPVRSTLDKKKLIAQGVTTAQIEAATVISPGKSYTKVTVPAEEDPEEE